MLLKRDQSGFFLLELIVGMTVLFSFLSLGARYVTQQAENNINKLTAQQLQQITQAAQQYVQDHFQLFKSDNSYLLDWQTLVDEGYLPSTLVDKNHYGQSYQFSVNTVNDQLQLLLTTTGGQVIREASLRQIAARVGGMAGYASILHPKEIIGTHEGWRLTGVPLDTGHLASLTLLNEHEIMDASSFLRRVKIAGQSEFNRMDTDLEIDSDKSIFFKKDGRGNGLNITNNGIASTGNDDGSIALYVGSNKCISISNGSNDTLINEEELTITRDRSIYNRITPSSVKLSHNSASEIILNNSNPRPSIVVKGNDKITYEGAVERWSRKTEITANWLRLPVYLYESGEFYTGESAAYDICRSHGYQEMEDGVYKHVGRMFIIHDASKDNFSLFICARNTAHIIYNYRK